VRGGVAMTRRISATDDRGLKVVTDERPSSRVRVPIASACSSAFVTKVTQACPARANPSGKRGPKALFTRGSRTFRADWCAFA